MAAYSRLMPARTIRHQLAYLTDRKKNVLRTKDGREYDNDLISTRGVVATTEKESQLSGSFWWVIVCC